MQCLETIPLNNCNHNFPDDLNHIGFSITVTTVQVCIVGICSGKPDPPHFTPETIRAQSFSRPYI